MLFQDWREEQRILDLRAAQTPYAFELLLHKLSGSKDPLPSIEPMLVVTGAAARMALATATVPAAPRVPLSGLSILRKFVAAEMARKGKVNLPPEILARLGFGPGRSQKVH